jgi:fructose-specific phosphotransferase system component IIB
MARPEDLVIFKALAARPKDIEDATALIAMHEIDLDRVRRRVEELADLAEEPRLINEVEAIISRAHTARSARSGATTGKARKRKKSSDKDDAVKMRGKKATPRPRL